MPTHEPSENDTQPVPTIEPTGELEARTFASGVFGHAHPEATGDSERLPSKDTFDVQAQAVTSRLTAAMPGGQSRHEWAPDLLKDLQRTADTVKEEGFPEGDISVKAATSLISPDVWRNQRGEMDAVNLLLSKIGAVSRDHVLSAIRQQIGQKLAAAQEAGSGSVDFVMDTPGVHTRINYEYAENGTIKSIRPEIVIDPTAEIAA